VNPRRASGSLAFVGGGEWEDGCREFDAELIAASRADEVVVLPTAAAFEHADRVGQRAVSYFESLGVPATVLGVLHRGEAEDPKTAALVRKAKFVYLSDGSPLHLRSVLKGSALFEALLAVYQGGGVVAASGAGATLLGDPMVDPRGGAYTVGLGAVRNLAVFPYHGTAAEHLRARSIDLLPASATLVGIDEQTALWLRGGVWKVVGAGQVSVYDRDGNSVSYGAGAEIEGLPA
jgi:cyanophycinase